MSKIACSKWNVYHIPRVCGALFHCSSTPPDSLFLRISRAGNPNIPITRVLGQWVEEGRRIKQSELRWMVKHLRTFRRFKHALQLSDWMSNEMSLPLLPRDIAIRLDLIAKVHGLDQAERYFNSISGISTINIKVYGALLNCYAEHKSVKKAEAIMQKIKEYSSNHEIDMVLNYNVMLNLYAQIGEYEKLDCLMQEMKEKNIYNNFALTTRLNAYVTTSDIEGMEKLLMQMEVDPLVTLDWLTYFTAAKGYLKVGYVEKSLAMLKKSEQLIEGKMRRIAYESLLSMYAAIGKKEDVYRIWNMCKKLYHSRNSSYFCMLAALVKLNDMDGAERILEEWESGNTQFEIRIPNFMISAYCKNGLLEKAKAYIWRVLKRGKELDGSIWDTLARGYCKYIGMDNAVEIVEMATLGGRLGWKPYPFILAACIEHMKDKGDLELALEILRICEERGHLSGVTCFRLSSYVHGKIPETKALDLMKADFPLELEDVEVPRWKEAD